MSDEAVHFKVERTWFMCLDHLLQGYGRCPECAAEPGVKPRVYVTRIERTDGVITVDTEEP